jgi:hypothetical protein
MTKKNLESPPSNRRKGLSKKITAVEVFELVQEVVRLLPTSKPKKNIELEVPRFKDLNPHEFRKKLNHAEHYSILKERK